jgi:succinate dehydrogenase / fumarate reductase flavoprotein subunit
VFGRLRGNNAAVYAGGADFVDLPADPEARVVTMIERLRGGAGGERVSDIRNALQETMDANASVYRTEQTLKQAAVDIAALKERYARVTVQDKGRRYNTDLLEAVELGFLLDLADVLVACAQARTESRGGHFREDYPTRDDVNFMRHTMAYKDGEEIRLDYKPVTVTRYQPMERKY